MIEYRISSFAELHSVLEQYRRDNRWMFRGQNDPAWPLLPKAGRPPFSRSDDIKYLASWKRRAVQFVPVHVSYSEWDWLAVAQHHGLATRLLDWTFHPLAAFFFAAYGSEDSACAVYAFRVPMVIDVATVTPKEFIGVGRVKPSGIIPRIVHQAGLFTVHGPPTLSLEKFIESQLSESSEVRLEKLVVEPAYSANLLFELNQYGYNMQTLFPDLDGLSRYVNWAVANIDYWNSVLDGGG